MSECISWAPTEHWRLY